MNTIVKHFIKPLSACLTLIGCLLLAIIALVLINPSAVTRLAQDSIQKIVRQHTDEKVKIGVIHWGIFPLTIKAHNVCILDNDPDKSLILTLENVQLKPNIWRFLLGDYSGTMDIRINNALSLQADSKWSAENQSLALNNAIFKYTLANKDPIILRGHFQVSTRERTLNGLLQGPNMREAIVNFELQNTVVNAPPTGHLKISVTEGNIPGIALIPLLEHIQASVQSFIKLPFKQQLVESTLMLDTELSEWKTQANTHQALSTPFTVLEATATLDKGILINQDLRLTQKSLSIKGHGTMNLSDGSLDFHALATLNSDPANENKHNQEAQAFFNNTPLKIAVRGSLQDPLIHPELTAYFKSAVQQLSHNTPEQKQAVEESSIKTFENLFETQHSF